MTDNCNSNLLRNELEGLIQDYRDYRDCSASVFTFSILISSQLEVPVG